MAKNNRSKAPVSTVPTGFKMRNGANSKANEKTEKSYRKPLSKTKKIWIAVSATALIVAITVGIILAVFLGAKSDDYFDYATADLSEYISFSSDYKSITLDSALVEYTDQHLVRQINKLLVKYKQTSPLYDGLGTRNLEIGIGDVVKIWFRGYTVDENGKQVDVPDGSNFSNATAADIEIGSGVLIMGFEESLMGKKPEDYVRFEKIKSGTVESTDVVYFTYTSYSLGASKSATAERIDLSRDDIDAVYGTGFKDYLIGKSIGKIDETKTFPLGEGTVGYADMTVNFVTRCEADPLKVTLTFPNDYSDKTLRGQSVIYDIYIDVCVKYTPAEYTEEFITKTLHMTENFLSAYEGETLLEKHTSYMKEKAIEDIELSNNQILTEEFWEKITPICKVEQYPTSEVDKYYASMYNEVATFYSNYGSSYGFDSIDAAAISYYSLDSGADWQGYIEALAKEEVKSQLIFNYILRAENINLSDSELKAEGDKQIAIEVEYQLENRIEEFKEYTAEEYKEQLSLIEKTIRDWFGEDNLNDLAKYNLGMKKIVSNVYGR